MKKQVEVSRRTLLRLYESGDLSATTIEDSNSDGLADVTQLAALGPARAMGAR